jgi:flagellar basal-body rod protein FlgF
MATPGYRAKHSFSQALSNIEAGQAAEQSQVSLISLTAGLLTQTGKSSDLAIDGEGFFELRGEDGLFYTRNGQFTRAGDGRLLDPAGRALQGAGGGDVVAPADFSVAADGSVMDGDERLARIVIVSFEAAAARSGPDGLVMVPPSDVSTVDAPVVRQGYLESSNVSLGDEMIALMEAVRRAETGQKLMNVYDDLLGRAVTTFGQVSG